MKMRFYPIANELHDITPLHRAKRIAYGRLITAQVDPKNSNRVILEGSPRELAAAAKQLIGIERQIQVYVGDSAVSSFDSFNVSGPSTRKKSGWLDIPCLYNTDWLGLFNSIERSINDEPEPVAEAKAVQSDELSAITDELTKIVQDAARKAAPVLIKGRKVLIDEIKSVFAR